MYTSAVLLQLGREVGAGRWHIVCVCVCVCVCFVLTCATFGEKTKSQDRICMASQNTHNPAPCLKRAVQHFWVERGSHALTCTHGQTGCPKHKTKKLYYSTHKRGSVTSPSALFVIKPLYLYTANSCFLTSIEAECCRIDLKDILIFCS